MDRHQRAVAMFLRVCAQVPSVLGVLAYGSFGRGEYTRNSDVDLAVFLDSGTIRGRDVQRLTRGVRAVRRRYRVTLDTDFILDREVELFNRGILLDGRALSDLDMYRTEGKILCGEDFRNRFRIPRVTAEVRDTALLLVLEHFKRWMFHNEGSKVPWWFPAWALTVALNALGVLEIPGRDGMLAAVGRHLPRIRQRPEVRKFASRPGQDVLSVDQFLGLLRALHRAVQQGGPASRSPRRSKGGRQG